MIKFDGHLAVFSTYRFACDVESKLDLMFAPQRPRN